MLLTNSQNRYGMIAILLHWVMAILLVILLITGLYMTGLTFSLQKLKWFAWHKQLGILAFLLATLRLLWRLKNHGEPTLPAYLPKWQQSLSLLIHYSFYVLMFALPLTGWLITSASNLPLSFFGLFVLPDLVSANEHTRLFFSNVHLWLAYLLIFSLCLHSLAAFKHHFIDKDDILRRIL